MRSSWSPPHPSGRVGPGDDFVPVSASRALAAARSDIVEFDEFDTARHTKLWNYDEERWTASIRTWLERAGITGAAGAGS